MSDECKHGSPRRSCEICERDDEIDRIRQQWVDQSVDLYTAHQRQLDEIERLQAELTAAEKVVEAARPFLNPYAYGEPKVKHSDLEIDCCVTITYANVERLREAFRAYDAAKGGEDD
jgi:hypothetical protein